MVISIQNNTNDDLYLDTMPFELDVAGAVRGRAAPRDVQAAGFELVHGELDDVERRRVVLEPPATVVGQSFEMLLGFGVVAPGHGAGAAVLEPADERGFVIITHYQRMLDYITPDVVHVFLDGRIVATGGPDLADQIEEAGYDHYRSGAAAS